MQLLNLVDGPYIHDMFAVLWDTMVSHVLSKPISTSTTYTTLLYFPQPIPISLFLPKFYNIYYTYFLCTTHPYIIISTYIIDTPSVSFLLSISFRYIPHSTLTSDLLSHTFFLTILLSFLAIHLIPCLLHQQPPLPT